MPIFRRIMCRIAVWGLLLATISGCRQATWRTYEETTLAAPMEDVSQSMPTAPHPMPAAPGPTLHWTVPEGWTEEPGSGMRLATLLVGRNGETGVCSLIVLKGAGGGLEANVRRWIGQLNLPELSNDELSAFLQRQEQIQCEGGFEGVLVDFARLGAPSPDTESMLAASITMEQSSLFVKLMGPPALLEEEKAAFAALCRSIRRAP